MQIHPCRPWLWWDWRMERQILRRGWWPRPAIIQGKEVLVVLALATNLLGQKCISVLSTLEQCGLGASSCSQAPELLLLPGSRKEVGWGGRCWRIPLGHQNSSSGDPDLLRPGWTRKPLSAGTRLLSSPLPPSCRVGRHSTL